MLQTCARHVSCIYRSLPLLQDLPDAAKMHSIAEKWRPFASLGSYYMWKVRGH